MPYLTRDVEPLAYSPGEAAKALGMSRSGVYRLLEDGHLTARKSPGGGRTFILRAELERFLAECPTFGADADA